MSLSLSSRRRQIGRELTRVADASVSEVLSQIGGEETCSSYRVGVTGAPGSGKSTLISGLAGRRLRRMGDALLGILAIDPSSAVSSGSILGDRIRFDAISDAPNLFVRSVPGRLAKDGLCHNAVDLLAVLERHGFQQILLETVGVGQSEVDVRNLVDTLILVVPPDAGDTIQAMKAGVMEVASIFVVSKSERPEARRMESEIRSVLDATRPRTDGWAPPVIRTNAEGSGLDELDAAIERHAAFLGQTSDKADVAARRRLYHLESLLARDAAERLRDDPDRFQGRLAAAYALLVEKLTPLHARENRKFQDG